MDAAENSEELLGARGGRRRAGDLHSASAAEEEAVKEHAQWRNPHLEARWTATRAPAAEEVDAGT